MNTVSKLFYAHPHKCQTITALKLYIIYRKGVSPSAFLATQRLKVRDNQRSGKGKGKFLSYDRDIMCLPKSFGEQSDLIKIPKKSVREFLAINK